MKSVKSVKSVESVEKSPETGAPSAASPEIEFDPVAHVYRVGGQVKPNVTLVIEEVGLYGAAAEYWDQASAWYGSVVHRCCQLDDEGDLDPATVHPDAVGRIEAWRRFRRETGFQPVLIEQRLYHPHLGFCTTIDREGDLPGLTPSRAVVDLKAGQIHPAHGVQLAAHVHTLPGNPQGCQRVAVRLRNDGSYSMRIFPLEDLDTDWTCFVAALNIFNWKKLRGIR